MHESIQVKPNFLVRLFTNREGHPEADKPIKEVLIAFLTKKNPSCKLIAANIQYQRHQNYRPLSKRDGSLVEDFR
jgi:hypothetical protein